MKVYEGKVVRKKMNKTATVEIVRIVVHPLYKKRYKRSRIFHVHDELNSSVGQVVKFVDCKPISKLKRWKVIEISGVSGKKSESGKKKESKIVKKDVKRRGAKK